MDPSVQVEDLKWTPVHTLLFIAFSIGTTVEAYIYSLSYIATSWVAMPRTLLGLLAVWPPLWLLLGGAVSGPLADWIGRKKHFLSHLAYMLLVPLDLFSALHT
ncbi:hypothetical protein [Acidiplasma cupricumulans]|uniref:hypothetical protein n=1 Tax=Acidiplasma cupricumulans TaxID=312540 RepID=UPI000AF65F19|nr:hypothetical protein [Acidiplasma cupricumulans]